MASKGTEQVAGPRCFQELEDAEMSDFPVKSIPLESRNLPRHQALARRKNRAQGTRAQNKAQSTRAQNKAQSTRAQNKAQSIRAQNKAQGTRAQNKAQGTRAQELPAPNPRAKNLRAQHAPRAENPQVQEADKDGSIARVLPWA